MNICGFQKLTLLDYPGHLACTIFTGGCNFRCPFCHNASLVLHPMDTAYSTESILSYLSTRQGILEGICISGGEPTLQPDLCSFIKQVKTLNFLVKLDTNGTNPDLIQTLIQEQLIDYIAMDIKNSLEHYDVTIGRTDYDLSDIKKSAEIIMDSTIPYEFRTTVVSQLHNASDFESIGRWLRGAKQFYLQSFVDSGDIIGDGLSACTKDELEEFLRILQKSVPNACIRGIE